MSIAIAIDLADPTPPFEQLRRQIADLIGTGQLLGGERLPPVRQLARDLGLANGTVARAYQELEQASLVTTRRGGGTTVSAQGIHPAMAARGRLDAAATAFATAARGLGFGADEAHEALARVWRDNPAG